MNTRSNKIRVLTVYFGLSILTHLLVLISLGRFGNYSFATPVNPLQVVMVDLTKPRVNAAPVADSSSQKPSQTDNVVKDVPDVSTHAQTQGEEAGTQPAVREQSSVVPKTVEPDAIGKEKTDSITRTSEPAITTPPPASPHMALAPPPPPLRTTDEFLSTQSEKLTYLISLKGIPVGNAELEAKNENGEVRISLRIRSNVGMSNIYSVNNVMETRHIAGNFIISKVRQQEGSIRSDIGFTIFLRDKRVFWFDRLHKRYSDETIPNSEVLDTLSSFYYLRNRSLQIGSTELLHIYDGDIYAPVPVEVVRQEMVQLRNLKKVETLLLRHIKQKDGIFKRTGDMLIWLTDDEHKVPVKIETTTPLGKVTVELVSAETQRPETQK